VGPNGLLGSSGEMLGLLKQFALLAESRCVGLTYSAESVKLTKGWPIERRQEQAGMPVYNE